MGVLILVNKVTDAINLITTNLHLFFDYQN